MKHKIITIFAILCLIGIVIFFVITKSIPATLGILFLAICSLLATYYGLEAVDRSSK